jgi:hypothetical protein
VVVQNQLAVANHLAAVVQTIAVSQLAVAKHLAVAVTTVAVAAKHHRAVAKLHLATAAAILVKRRAAAADCCLSCSKARRAA